MHFGVTSSGDQTRIRSIVTVIVASVMILSFFGIVFSSQGSSKSAAADSSQIFSSGSLENVQAAAFNSSSQQIGSMVVTSNAGAFSPSYQMSVYIKLKQSGSLSAYAGWVSDPSSLV